MVNFFFPGQRLSQLERAYTLSHGNAGVHTFNLQAGYASASQAAFQTSLNLHGIANLLINLIESVVHATPYQHEFIIILWRSMEH